MIFAGTYGARVIGAEGKIKASVSLDLNMKNQVGILTYQNRGTVSDQKLYFNKIF